VLESNWAKYWRAIWARELRYGEKWMTALFRILRVVAVVVVGRVEWLSCERMYFIVRGIFVIKQLFEAAKKRTGM
jgi:hypothetical protein